MIVKYFEETDTLFLELSTARVAETKEVAENLYLDFDPSGRVVSMTIEHAKETGVGSGVSYEVIESNGKEVRR